MSEWVIYDKENNVLFADYTNKTLTIPIIEQVVAEIKDLSQQISQRVYLLSCFQNTKLTPDLQEAWGKYVQQILESTKGIIRYSANELLTNVTIRSSTVIYHTQGNNSYLYPTKESALQAIRQLEHEQK